MVDDSPIRFVDVLTTASAAANYRGEPVVEARHLTDAVHILQGEMTVEDLGRPMSPLVASRLPRGGASPEVQELVQRWYAELGDDPSAVLDEVAVGRLLGELAEIDRGPGP